ncbi:MAG: lipopolysaccharide biosynthesis protein [Gemmatimonadaceae bacterium]
MTRVRSAPNGTMTIPTSGTVSAGSESLTAAEGRVAALGSRLRSGVLQRLVGRSWPLADQTLVSAANFVTMVLLARGMSQVAFGRFTLFYSVLLFANGMQSSLITQPHNVLAVGLNRADYRRYTASTAVAQVVAVVVIGIVSLVAGIVAWLAGWDAAPLLLMLAPSIVAWQLQEFTRRVLYTERRFAAAFANDVISYGGQGVAIALLWRTGALTPVLGLVALAATSALGAAFGIFQLRDSIDRHFDIRALHENWRFGKWLAASEILRSLSSAELYQYLAAGFLGAAATAMLKSAQVVFGPARLLAFSLNNILPVHFAHSLRDGQARLDAELRRALVFGGLPLGAYCLLVALYARPILRFLYGEKYADASGVLVLFAVSAFVGYMAMIVSAALQARRMTRSVFMAYLYSSVVAVSSGWMLIRSFGLTGALIGMIATTLIANVVFWRSYLRTDRSVERSGGHLE